MAGGKFPDGRFIDRSEMPIGGWTKWIEFDWQREGPYLLALPTSAHRISTEFKQHKKMLIKPSGSAKTNRHPIKYQRQIPSYPILELTIKFKIN